MRKIIAVLNTKGGASKSTFAFQVIGGYFLPKKQPVRLMEFDDENKDSEKFGKSAIKTEQIKVGDGSAITDILRKAILESNKEENLVLDVGGNKTTTIFIEGLKKSMLYRKIDLIVIPMSGGYQDLDNAKKTYELIKAFNIPVVFGLSRIRNMERAKFQYDEFFKSFPNEKYIELKESDVIDLSRNNKKSVYEIAVDTELKTSLEASLVEAFDSNDNVKAKFLSFQFEIATEAEEYLDSILTPAWNELDSFLMNNNEDGKDARTNAQGS